MVALASRQLLLPFAGGTWQGPASAMPWTVRGAWRECRRLGQGIWVAAGDGQEKLGWRQRRAGATLVPNVGLDDLSGETTVPDPFVGEIRMFGFSFAPQGWALCNGQLLPIAQNQALFSLLGTTYGGNGTTTFALPDLRSRVPVHQGQGPGLSPYAAGQAGGTETVTLAAADMPQHTHPVQASSSAATSDNPAGRALARSASHIYHSEPGPHAVMNANMLGEAGGSQPHDNIQPYLAVTFCIALTGIFPAQN
jgi:microcystin-dependent protein